ncbi:hypothetical protein TNCV_1275361 [Trichonephila clavipes]|nr:hypothetical protein TNCV_1275361 [Trichonephila clavipes]
MSAFGEREVTELKIFNLKIDDSRHGGRVEGITADDPKSISSQEITQAIEKVLVSKGEQIQTRSTDQYTVVQSVVVEKEKEEISVDVIKDKDESNPVILRKERIDFDEDEIEEEKLKLPKRKRKNLSRRTVAEL